MPEQMRRATLNDPDTIYASTPALRQQRLPHTRMTTRRRPATHAPPTLQHQQTLTQIEFIETPERDYDEERDWNESMPSAKRRRTGRNGRKWGEVGESQRTLTQMVPGMRFVDDSNDEEEEEDDDSGLILSDEEEEQNHDGGLRLDGGEEVQGDAGEEAAPVIKTETPDTYEEESISRTLTTQRSNTTTHSGYDGIYRQSTSELSSTPQTPQRQRILEVPSSQTPPYAPLSTQKGSQHHSRSPLRERLANPHILDTPSKLRQVTFSDSAIKLSTMQSACKAKKEPSTPYTRVLLRRTSTHVLDSDEGDEEETESEEEAAEDHDKNEAAADQSFDEGELVNEHNYDIGPETEAVVNEIGLSSSLSGPADAPPRKSPELGSSLPQSTIHTLDFDLGTPIASQSRHATQESNATDEVAEQLRSEINYTQRHTQYLPPSSPIDLSAAIDELPAHDEEVLPTLSTSFHPSQATTIDITQKTQRTQRQQLESSPLRPPPILVPSSPIPLPPSSSPRRGRSHNGVPTISQLLPDSLMNFSIPPPPQWTQDSDHEV